MGGLVTVTGPTVEPLTLGEAKDHLRVTSAEEDSYIARLIKAARHHVEHVTSKQLLNATYRQDLDDWPYDCIELERLPLSSFTSITYYDSDNVQQTFSSSNYVVDSSHTRPRVVLAYNASWPTIYLKPNAVSVNYVAGYGALASLVPDDLRHAVELLLAHWYENREPVVVGSISSNIPLTVDRLLMPHRMALV